MPEFCVIVDCGYSEWFDVHDMRVHGPWSSQEAANAAAEELLSLGLNGREGRPLLVYVMPFLPLDVDTYAREWARRPEPEVEPEVDPGEYVSTIGDDTGWGVNE